MSKMQEAWEYWNMTLEDNWPYTKEAFEAGYQAAIAAVKESDYAIVVRLNDGEKIIDASMRFFDEIRLGTKLYKLPEDTP